MLRIRTLAAVAAILLALGLVGTAGAAPQADRFDDLPHPAELRPMDLVIDQRGLGYLRGADGGLTPYGHSVAADRQEPRAKGGQPGPPGGGGGSDAVTFGDWDDGQVMQSAGRILFEKEPGVWYVCSGTVVEDDTTGRTLILTAAHCIYDDVAKSFAYSAIFVPSQDDGGVDKSDFDCSNDPHGCWVLDHGVVDLNWTTRTFPDNIPWDYGYYVVSDTNSHSSSPAIGNIGSLSLDGTVGAMSQSFSAPAVGQEAHALGYSYNVDPAFKYCAESLGTSGSANYWLGQCQMTGGSSGGPWVQPMDEVTGNGPVFSVNSWGYSNRDGMAGPKLHGTSAAELFAAAKVSPLGNPGVVWSAGETTTTTTSTTTPTTTTVPSGDLTASSSNQRRTWTATVTGPSDLQGTFDGAMASCTEGTCTMEGIRKSTGSVTFVASAPSSVAGESILVIKP